MIGYLLKLDLGLYQTENNQKHCRQKMYFLGAEISIRKQTTGCSPVSTSPAVLGLEYKKEIDRNLKVPLEKDNKS